MGYPMNEDGLVENQNRRVLQRTRRLSIAVVSRRPDNFTHASPTCVQAAFWQPPDKVFQKLGHAQHAIPDCLLAGTGLRVGE